MTPADLPLSRRRFVARTLELGTALSAATLAGCSGFDSIAHDPGRMIRDPKPYRPAEPRKFATIINAYRAKFGLSPLGVDDRLTAIALTYSRHLADANQMSHDLAPWGPLRKRLQDAGYPFLVAGENLGEGYRDMDEVFEGWRLSPGHEREMRDPDATVMGIGSSWRDQSTYKAYWCLILAKPRPAGSPAGEPLVAVRRQPEPETTTTFGGVQWPF